MRALASHQCGPVQILASKPYVGWVCCWFSPLLREIFLRVLRFPLSSSTRNGVDKEPLCGCAISKSLFIYLFIYLCIYLFIYLFIILLFLRTSQAQKMAKWMHFRSTPRSPIWNITGNWRLLPYTFLFFKSPSLWFKSLLEFKKAFM